MFFFFLSRPSLTALTLDSLVRLTPFSSCLGPGRGCVCVCVCSCQGWTCVFLLLLLFLVSPRLRMTSVFCAFFFLFFCFSFVECFGSRWTMWSEHAVQIDAHDDLRCARRNRPCGWWRSASLNKQEVTRGLEGRRKGGDKHQPSRRSGGALGTLSAKLLSSSFLPSFLVTFWSASLSSSSLAYPFFCCFLHAKLLRIITPHSSRRRRRKRKETKPRSLRFLISDPFSQSL